MNAAYASIPDCRQDTCLCRQSRLLCGCPEQRVGCRTAVVLLYVLFSCLLLSACHSVQSREPYPLPKSESPLRDFAKWRNIVKAEQASSSFSPEGLSLWAPRHSAEWRHLRRQLEKESLLGKARLVNAFFNQRPYISDKQAWGVEEHWARPLDFMNKGGDCEDYAIAKYYALRAMGVPASDLRLAGLWNFRKKEGHAVLLLITPKHTYVLDNEERDLPLLETVHWYKVYYLLNEDTQWTHAEAL
ncbi:transglutaminase-like cysteine peptidase [Desulfovibrio sp. OttesenSCG-928-G15]|nr:transglutaminase-like cysteine peptidase [Desulfovibrio sp. OttesenSCG-928-G15]